MSTVNEVMNNTVTSFENALESLKELQALLNNNNMLAKNVAAIDIAAQNVVINGNNLAVVNGEVLKDNLSASTTESYAGRSFLRHVMRMMFNMLEYNMESQTKITDFYGHKINDYGYDGAMRKRFYNYKKQFQFLVGKDFMGQNHGFLHRMAEMEKVNDPALIFYEMAWGRTKLIKMLDCYLQDVLKYIPEKASRNCRNAKRYLLRNASYGKYVRKSEFERTVTIRMNNVKLRLSKAATYEDVRIVLKDFLKNDYIPIIDGNYLNKEFVDSYKLFGSYWTMNNLIGWHGCKISGRTRQQSMNELNENILNMQGYEALAMLKKLIKDNNYDFHNDEYIKEFYEKKAKKTA